MRELLYLELIQQQIYQKLCIKKGFIIISKEGDGIAPASPTLTNLGDLAGTEWPHLALHETNPGVCQIRF